MDIARALRQAHRCPAGCRACSAERQELREPPLAERWAAFLQSPAALRLGRLRAEHGVPLPRLADDELEQWLLEEAVMLRWSQEVEQAEEQEEARRQAREAGAELLAEELARRRGEAG